MSGPLEGVRVVDLTMNVMGPYAAQTLGDMGADVIKVEPPEGDTCRGVGPSPSGKMGPLFVHLNRNKRSLALDLKQADGKAVLDRLVARADVFLYSLRPAAMKRLGLSYEALAAINPRIIYCGAFGYGQNGPYAAKPAYDDLIQGAIGLPALQARDDGEPNYVTTAIIDRTVGLVTASMVGFALYSRERTGKGQAIEIPMFETMVHFVMGDHLYGRTFEPPVGPVGYPRLLSRERRPYRTRDGYVCTLIYTDKHWRRFFELAGRPDIGADPRYATIGERTRHIVELYGFLADTFLSRTTAEWLEALEKADIPAMPLHTPESLLQDPHLTEIGFFRTEAHASDGVLRTMGMPSTWSGTPPEIRLPPPVLGQHTGEVLAELGYSVAETRALFAARAAVSD